MNNKKLSTIVVLILLTLGISWLIPNVAGAGRENSLVERVRVLEEQVALLIGRVDELEEGGGGDCCDTFDVVHLTPLDDFPAEPSEGDLCIKKEYVPPSPPGIWPGGYNYLWCYMDGEWRSVAAYATFPE